jgi:alanine racemase
MTLRLVVDQSAWNAHVQDVASALHPVVPVVKGNGYGFGRSHLMGRATELSNEVAVGTVYELADVPQNTIPIVLTPVDNGCTVDLRPDAIYTVGSVHHVATLRSLGFEGRVIVKLRSRMQRYGVEPDALDGVTESITKAGWAIHGWSIHPPLSSTSTDHVQEIASWANDLEDDLPIYVSHVDRDGLDDLRGRFPRHEFRARSGTTLWLGDKSMLKLEANVVDTRATRGGLAGYRQVAVPGDGSIVLVGCGTAHGIFERPDGLSPFHFQRTRLHLLESPHMHTSMVFIPEGAEVPLVGEWIDVQQSMTRALVDTITWT